MPGLIPAKMSVRTEPNRTNVKIIGGGDENNLTLFFWYRSYVFNVNKKMFLKNHRNFNIIIVDVIDSFFGQHITELGHFFLSIQNFQKC